MQQKVSIKPKLFHKQKQALWKRDKNQYSFAGIRKHPLIPLPRRFHASLMLRYATVSLHLLAVLAALLHQAAAQTSLPAYQVSILKKFYDTLDGPNWRMQGRNQTLGYICNDISGSAVPITGAVWDFSPPVGFNGATPDPCTFKGVTCAEGEVSRR